MTIPTWETGPAEVHSIFYDGGGRRGSTGIYPYTLKEVLTDRKVDRTYNAVVLENEYVKILILPEIGGRLHGALDKTNGYVWLYWQKTIKPGLIGMTGAWISGGIEWNFPHGHRPSGFSPVDHRIVKNAGGSATVWVGETEPIYRSRWLAGMTLSPGRSDLRCDYVLMNPSEHRIPFMFWATAATHANEWAQAQYPGDMVTGHGKQEFWNWPVHNGADLTWWKNSPNASSYFAFNNPSDWFGTYDHKAQAGMVHVADHHVMPGKKLWTWGSGPSGRIWEEILTEGGGAYFEPQAGAWSDNQPDYHWMQPYEVKRAHDYWYPVRGIRGYHNATRDFAVNTELDGGVAFAGVYSTSPVRNHRIVLRDTRANTVLRQETADIAPDKPYTVEVKAPPGTTVHDLHLAVYDPSGALRIELQRAPPRQVELPGGLKDPGDPRKMTQDELYHAGEWLDRFVRGGEALEYYQEALKRDPRDSRVNLELGFHALRAGRWQDGVKHLDIALARDSDNGRIHFGKALAALGEGKHDEAYRLLFRASWSREHFAAAYLQLACLDLRRGGYAAAIGKLDEAASANGRFAGIPALKAAACRRLGDHRRALEAAERALELDPMHCLGANEKLLALAALGGGSASEWEAERRSILRGEAQNFLELATAYGNAGLYREADAILSEFSQNRSGDAIHPSVNYLRGYYRELAGDATGARRFYQAARKGPVDYTNPHRLEEAAALEAALRFDPRDSRARLFLGNLLYAKGRREEGLRHWESAAANEPGLIHALRNIAYARRHLHNDLAASYEIYRKAAALKPDDARILLELDQVAEALKRPPGERYAALSTRLETVYSRDDLVARLADLRLQRGRPDDLAAVHRDLASHHFHSWEGKYGIHHAWVEVNQRLGDLAFQKRDYAAALQHYRQAGEYPKNLEVAPRTPDFRAHVNWNLARVYRAMGNPGEEAKHLKLVLAEKYSRAHLGTYYQALAGRASGNEEAYRALLDKLEQRARELTSGKFEHRGSREAVGHYLLSLVLAEKGDAEGAAAAHKRAVKDDWRIARQAILEAQLDFARAHQ